MQAALNKPLTKPADSRFIGDRFVGIQLHKFLKAEPIPQLFLGLWIAQAIEVLQDHDPQQHPDPTAGPPAMAVGGPHAGFGLGEIDLLSDDLKHAISRPALLNSQIEEGGLGCSCSLHEALDRVSGRVIQNTFAEISYRVGTSATQA